MKVLLDTNALVWLLEASDKAYFGNQALKIIESSDEVYVSSISVLEIRIKTILGKFKSDKNLLDDIDRAGLKSLSFSMPHADALLNFPTLSKHDPFDRMLIAQAFVENMALLTSDAGITTLGLPFVINAHL